MIPHNPFPPQSLKVFRTTSITQEFTFNITVELGLHFTVIPDRLIVIHRTIQVNNPAGPDNAYFILLHKILGNVTLLAGP
jgi:hypothetical protein